MEKLTSRKNKYLLHLKRLGDDSTYRRECGEFLCEGMKTLRDALAAGAAVSSVLWKNEPDAAELQLPGEQYLVPPDLFDWCAPMKNCPGPLFTVKMREREPDFRLSNAIVLENVQDPGNVGTVLRTANAFGIHAVILVGNCADAYGFKTARASMGAVFRQRILTASPDELSRLLAENGMKLYGAALHQDSLDIRTISLSSCAVAIGSEGNGLSGELLSRCDATVVIPMRPESESLNAAVAASVAMWEMSRPVL